MSMVKTVVNRPVTIFIVFVLIIGVGIYVVRELPIDLRQTPIDLLSLSGHKLHAPKGIGALYVRRGSRLRPIIIGGHQERSRREQLG